MSCSKEILSSMFDLQQEKAILTSDGLLIEDVCIYFRFFNQLHCSRFKKLVLRKKVIRLFMVLRDMLCIFQTLLCG